MPVSGSEPKVTLDLALATASRAEEYDRIIRLPRPGAHLHRARPLLRPLVRALRLQALARLPARACRPTGPHVLQGPGENAGHRGPRRRARRWPSRSRATTTRRSSSRSRARRPGWAASSATSSRWARAPSRVLDSLRFGDPATIRGTRRLIEGVVSGISWYGNCFGVPDRRAARSPSRRSTRGNPLVNAMAVGLVRKDRIFRARAEGVGNPVFYVGAKTGRDGIHGATMASATFDERAEERRPTVQVGDPFTEKLLLEACLEAMADRRHRRHPGHGRGRAGLRLLRDARAGGHGHGRGALPRAPARDRA